MYELACIDCMRGDYAIALEHIDESIGLNKGHTKAHNLKTAIARKIGCECARQSATDGVKRTVFPSRNLRHYISTDFTEKLGCSELA